MSTVHERNLSNGERALENLRANMASGMPPEEVLLRLGSDFDALDFDAFASYTVETEPENNHPEVPFEKYFNLMLKMSFLKRYFQDYLDGKTTPAETLTAISVRFEIPSAYWAGPDPGQATGEEGRNRDPAGDATASPRVAVQLKVVQRLEATWREEITSLRDRVNGAVRGGAFADAADPMGTMVALFSLQKECAALLTSLDQAVKIVPSLSAYQAFEEEIKFQLEVLEVVKKVKGLDPMVWREPPATQTRPPRQPIQPRRRESPDSMPMNRSPRSTRYAPPPPPPFGLSYDSWYAIKVVAGLMGDFVFIFFLWAGCLAMLAGSLAAN